MPKLKNSNATFWVIFKQCEWLRKNIQSAFCSLLWFLISRSMLVSFRGLATHNNFLPQKLMLCRQLLNSCVPYHLHGNGGRGCAVLYQAGELLNNNAIAPRCRYYTLPGLFLPTGKNFFFFSRKLRPKGVCNALPILLQLRKTAKFQHTFGIKA